MSSGRAAFRTIGEQRPILLRFTDDEVAFHDKKGKFPSRRTKVVRLLLIRSYSRSNDGCRRLRCDVCLLVHAFLVGSPSRLRFISHLCPQQERDASERTLKLCAKYFQLQHQEQEQQPERRQKRGDARSRFYSASDTTLCSFPRQPFRHTLLA